MTFTFKTLAAAGAILLLPLSAQAYTLTFEGLDSSATQLDTPPNQLQPFTEGGIEWFVTGVGTGLGPAIFNSTCAGYTSNCNGDPDLSPLVQGQDGISGNILIFQEDSGPIPNDDRGTVSLTLELLSDVSLRWTGVSLIDNGRYTFETSQDGALDPVIDITKEGNVAGGTAMAALTSSILTKGDTITVNIFREGSNNPGDSGGVDTFTFSVIPLPAPFALLLAAMGGFGFLSWRRARAAA